MDHGWKGYNKQNTDRKNLENGKNRKNKKIIDDTFQQISKGVIEQGVGNWRLSIALDISDIAGKWH